MPDSRRPIVIDDLYRIAYVENPQISPDGRWIAYVQRTLDRVENGYRTNIWVAPTNGDKAFQLTRGGKDSTPRWSPDSQWLAFVSTREKNPQVYALRVHAPGGDPVALTSHPNGASSPAWSPDGSQIAYLARLNAEERARDEGGEEEPAPRDKLEVKHREERREEEERLRWDPRRTWRIPYRQLTSFLDDRYAQVFVGCTNNL
jgi:dipeptidyl aminopeptidase/acylaminoacyl peptidase